MKTWQTKNEAAGDVQAIVEFQAVADENVGLLGLTPYFDQPGGVFVQAVHPQTWASRVGIRKGDEIVRMNGKDTLSMPKLQLSSEMRERPLHLRIRSSGASGNAESSPGMVRSASVPSRAVSPSPKTMREFRQDLMGLSCSPGKASSSSSSKRPARSQTARKPARDVSKVQGNLHPAERTTAAILWNEMEETIATQEEQIQVLTAQSGVKIPGKQLSPSQWDAFEKILQAKTAEEAWEIIQTYKRKGNLLKQSSSKELKSEDLLESQRKAEFARIANAPSTSLDRFIAALRAEVTRVLEADRCSIYFLDEVRQELWCVGSIDMDDFHIPLNQGIAGLVVSEGNAIKLDDVQSHPQFNPGFETKTGYSVKSMVACPIKHHGEGQRTIGVLQVLNKKRNARGQRGKSANAGFDDEDMRELIRITTEITDAFSRQRWTALEISASKGDRQATSMVESLSPIFDSVASTTNKSRATSAFTEDNIAALQTCSRDNLRQLPRELSKFHKIDFNVFDYSPNMLMPFAINVFQHAGLNETCRIPADSMQKWTNRVMRSYLSDITFHNWMHGFSVFHMVYLLLFSTPMYLYFRNVDLFGLLVAGLCHDIEHPGVNNSFLVNNQDQLAIRYNETSVLENHHAAQTIALMKNEDAQIDTGLSSDAVLSFRRTIIRGILATDMAHHHDMCQTLVSFEPGESEDVTPEDRNFLCKTCIHAADLSGQCYRWVVAAEWEKRISIEFSKQAARELELGQTPAPFMNLKMEDHKLRGKLQRDFIDFVLVPLWDPYSDMWHGMRGFFERLLINRGCYHHRSVTGQDPADERTAPSTPRQQSDPKRYEITTVMTVRAGESLESEYLVDLPLGTEVTILEYGVDRRALVQTAAGGTKSGLSGWVTITTKSGYQLLKEIE